MKSFISAALSITYLSLFSNQPLLAISASPCNQAMQKAKAQLASVKSLKTSRIPASAGAPRGRSTAVSIVLTTDRSMNNTPLQLGISKTITARCPTVGSVSFAVSETDWVNVYGLVNGRVKKFTCKEAGDKIRWGEQYCL